MSTAPSRWAARILAVGLAAVMAGSALSTAQAATGPLRSVCHSTFAGTFTVGAQVDLPALTTPPTPAVAAASSGGTGKAVITLPASLGDDVRRFADPTMRITGQVFGQVREGIGPEGSLVKELVWEASGSGSVGAAGDIRVPLALTTESTFTPLVAGPHTLSLGTVVLRLNNAAFEAPLDIVCVTDPSQDITIEVFEVTGPPVATPAERAPISPVEPAGTEGTSSASAPTPAGSPPTVVQTDWAIPPLGWPPHPASTTAAVLTPPSLAVQAPARISVRSAAGGLIVDAPMAPSMADADGIWSPPADLVGWYAAPGWVAPGATGTAVLAGHVGAADSGPGVFARLPQAQPGDTIDITTVSGTVRQYVVTRSDPVSKEQVPQDASIWAPATTSELRLITCDPQTPLVSGHFLGNWVVWARPA
ncbi:MAG: sortase [Phycicoccus sp.]|nr:sortase [Phycicoccus sp.]